MISSIELLQNKGITVKVDVQLPHGGYITELSKLSEEENNLVLSLKVIKPKEGMYTQMIENRTLTYNEGRQFENVKIRCDFN